MPLPMWGGTKETGVLTRALAGNLRFRQTSSALSRTFVGPLLDTPPVSLFLSLSLSLSLRHPLGVARPRFQGMEVRSALPHIDCGENYRAPASVLVLNLRTLSIQRSGASPEKSRALAHVSATTCVHHTRNKTSICNVKRKIFY